MLKFSKCLYVGFLGSLLVACQGQEVEGPLNEENNIVQEIIDEAFEIVVEETLEKEYAAKDFYENSDYFLMPDYPVANVLPGKLILTKQSSNLAYNPEFESESDYNYFIEKEKQLTQTEAATVSQLIKTQCEIEGIEVVINLYYYNGDRVEISSEDERIELPNNPTFELLLNRPFNTEFDLYSIGDPEKFNVRTDGNIVHITTYYNCSAYPDSYTNIYEFGREHEFILYNGSKNYIESKLEKIYEYKYKLNEMAVSEYYNFQYSNYEFIIDIVSIDDEEILIASLSTETNEIVYHDIRSQINGVESEQEHVNIENADQGIIALEELINNYPWDSLLTNIESNTDAYYITLSTTSDDMIDWRTLAIRIEEVCPDVPVVIELQDCNLLFENGNYTVQ